MTTRDKVFISFYLSLVLIFVLSIQLLTDGLKAEQLTPFVQDQAFYIIRDQTLSIGRVNVTIVCLVFLLSLYGSIYACCATRNSSGLAFQLVLVLEIILALGMLKINNQKEARDKLELSMLESLFEYNKELNPKEALEWDTTHMNLACCGFDNYKDWFTTPYGSKVDVPNSCCINSDFDCGTNALHRQREIESLVYLPGCFPIIKNYLNRMYWIFNVIVVLLISTPLLGLLLPLLEMIRLFPQTVQSCTSYYLSQFKKQSSPTYSHVV